MPATEKPGMRGDVRRCVEAMSRLVRNGACRPLLMETGVSSQAAPQDTAPTTVTFRLWQRCYGYLAAGGAGFLCLAAAWAAPARAAGPPTALRRGSRRCSGPAAGAR